MMIIRAAVTVALALGVLIAPLAAAEAQQAGKVYRIGFLTSGSPTAAAQVLDTFRQGLRDRGYAEGQNLIIDDRHADDKDDRLPSLLADLLRRKIDLLVTWGTPAGLAAKRGTASVPIVSFSTDPVRTGIVASLARPGGNITGVASFHSDLAAKRLELLREVAPSIARLAVIWAPANPGTTLDWSEARAAAQTLGFKWNAYEVRTVSDLERSLTAIAQQPFDALLVVHDLLVLAQRTRIADFALKNRLPAMFAIREYVDAGGLISYGVNFPDLWRRMALIVDKILKGAKPADLPIEQPTKFELVINLKTAKALGLTMPPAVLVRADQIIE